MLWIILMMSLWRRHSMSVYLINHCIRMYIDSPRFVFLMKSLFLIWKGDCDWSMRFLAHFRPRFFRSDRPSVIIIWSSVTHSQTLCHCPSIIREPKTRHDMIFSDHQKVLKHFFLRFVKDMWTLIGPVPYVNLSFGFGKGLSTVLIVLSSFF